MNDLDNTRKMVHIKYIGDSELELVAILEEKTRI